MKFSTNTIGVMGLLILLLGCLIICTMCYALVDAFAPALDEPVSTPYTTDVNVPRLELKCPSLIGKNEQGTATASVINQNGSNQYINLNISTYGFALTPIEPDTKITLTPFETVEMKWNIKPKEIGSYSIWFRMSNLDPSSSIPASDVFCSIAVIDTFGLTAQQSKSVGLWSIAVGSVLVIIWLCVRLRSKRKYSVERA
jgi:hypothetical protein